MLNSSNCLYLILIVSILCCQSELSGTSRAFLSNVVTNVLPREQSNGESSIYTKPEIKISVVKRNGSVQALNEEKIIK